MIIKNIDRIDHLYRLKAKIYDFARTMNSAVAAMDITFVQLFAVQVLVLIPFISILFKYQDYFPSAVSQVFRSLLVSNLIDQIGVSQTLVYFIIIAIYFIVFLFTSFHFTFESVLAPISNILGLLIKISHLLIVPLVDTAVYSYYDMLDYNKTTTRRLIGGVTAFLIVMSIIIICLQSFFEIRMLRKKTVFWCLDNSFHFYGLLFTVFKTIFICTQSISTRSICIISIGFYLYHSKVFRGIVGQAQRFIEASLDMYIVITDAAVFTSIVTHDPHLAFGLWLSAIAFAMTVSIIVIYQRQHRKLFIPTCDSPPEAFYNFYYCFREELKGDDGTGREKTRSHPSFIFHLHRFHCKDNCRLKVWLSMSDERQIESVIDTILTAKRNETLHNRIVNELWNLQRGKKCNVSVLLDKTLTIDQDFILYCIDKMSKDSETTIRSSEANKNTIIKLFYDLIYESANHYYLFYEELSRPHPIIDSLVSHGTQIHQKIAKLKTIYWQLQKQKLLNFKMIELYIEFMSKFVSDKALEKEDISQLVKLQQNVYFDDISEVYLPSLTFYRDTGKIQNANCEAQKLLQSTRFELKCKQLSEITYPKLSIEELSDIANRDELSIKQEPLFILLEKSEDSFSLGNINVCEKSIKGKKLLVMQVTEDDVSSQKTVFLVTRSFELQIVLRKISKIRSQLRERPLVIHWQQIFEKYILQNRDKIQRSRIVKVQVDDWSIIVKKLQCAVPGYYILKAQVLFLNQSDINTQKRKRHTVMSLQRSISKYHQQNSFEFHYTENSEAQKALIIGMKGNENMMLQKMKLKTLTALEKQLNGILVDNVIKQQKNYAKGIKTYRLFDRDLYNIDLEDRAAYEQTFEGKVVKEREDLATGSSSFECYIAVIVLLLTLTLIGFSAYYVIDFNSESTEIVELSTQHTNIDSFLVDYYRILGLLRDLNQETRVKFPNLSIRKQIEDSFSRIEVLKTQPLFGSQIKEMQFLGLKMRGTYVQLVDVVFAHVNEVLTNENETVIEEIQRTGVELVADMEEQQNIIFGEITQAFDMLTLLKNTILFCSIAVIIALVFIFIYFCYHSSEKIKQKLSPLLFLTDEEARIHQDNAAKIKYAVEMIRKNFEIDTQNLLIGSFQNKKRKHPKKVALSKASIVSIIVFATIALSVHLSCIFMFSSELSLSFQQFLSMKESSRAIIRSYGQQAEIANYYAEEGQIEEDQMQQVAQNMEYLSFHLAQLDYSFGLNQLITTLYFHNSCSILMPTYNMTLEECTNTAPEYTLKNPFEIGLAFYLNRQFFYFYNNISQVYAHTSIHSARFAQILTNLSVSFNNESTQNVFTIRDTVSVINYVLIALAIFYIISFFSIYYFFRLKAASIRQIVDFFREKVRANQNELQPKVNDITTSQDVAIGRETQQQKERKMERLVKSTTLEKEIHFTEHDN